MLNSLVFRNLDSFVNGDLFLSSSTINSVSPLVDVIEEEGKFVIEADVPGYSEDEIEINVEGKLLVVKGSKKSKRETKLKYITSERSYGTFSRSFSLPSSIDPESISATFKNGVLTIEVPKAPKHTPKKIKIKIE